MTSFLPKGCAFSEELAENGHGHLLNLSLTGFLGLSASSGEVRSDGQPQR
jgi:hypothetical protein